MILLDSVSWKLAVNRRKRFSICLNFEVICNKKMFKEYRTQCHLQRVLRYFYVNTSGWTLPLVSHEVITQRVSAAIFKIMGTTYLCELKRTWPCKVTWHHRSHGHSTNNMLFPIVSHWNRASILNRFRDICIEIYRGNDLDLSGYVTSPVTWPFHTPDAIADIRYSK